LTQINRRSVGKNTTNKQIYVKSLFTTLYFQHNLINFIFIIQNDKMMEQMAWDIASALLLLYGSTALKELLLPHIFLSSLLSNGHQWLMLTMYGAIPPVPYIFMAWYLIMHKDSEMRNRTTWYECHRTTEHLLNNFQTHSLGCYKVSLHAG
jgi:hypothetical protein